MAQNRGFVVPGIHVAYNMHTTSTRYKIGTFEGGVMNNSMDGRILYWWL